MSTVGGASVGALAFVNVFAQGGVFPYVSVCFGMFRYVRSIQSATVRSPVSVPAGGIVSDGVLANLGSDRR